MARVVRKDVLECISSQGRMRLITAMVQAGVIVEVLRCLGLPTHPPPAAKARPPPQAELELPVPNWER